MSKHQGNELSRFDAGLALANDEDFAIPEEVKREFGRYTVDDLWAAVDEVRLLDRAVKIRTGFVLMALKARLKGAFKNAIIERHGQAAFYARFHRRPTKEDAEICGRLGRTAYHAAWRCMCYARAALHLPEIAGRLGFNFISKALSLPAAQLHEIQEKVTGIPADIARILTEESINFEYQEMQKRKRKRAAQRRPARIDTEQAKAILEEARRGNGDQEWDELVAVRREAREALWRLVQKARSVKMTPERLQRAQAQTWEEGPLGRKEGDAWILSVFNRYCYELSTIWRPIESLPEGDD